MRADDIVIQFLLEEVEFVFGCLKRTKEEEWKMMKLLTIIHKIHLPSRYSPFNWSDRLMLFIFPRKAPEMILAIPTAIFVSSDSQVLCASSMCKSSNLAAIKISPNHLEQAPGRPEAAAIFFQEA